MRKLIRSANISDIFFQIIWTAKIVYAGYKFPYLEKVKTDSKHVFILMRLGIKNHVT